MTRIGWLSENIHFENESDPSHQVKPSAPDASRSICGDHRKHPMQRLMTALIVKIACLLMLPAAAFAQLPAESATKWDRVQTGGGCYTPTVVFSEIEPGLAYARTDVAGAYRWDNATSQWISLLDSTSWTDSHFNGVASVALSAQNADKVALACGLYSNGWDPLNGAILTSTNRGVTWTKTVMPFKIGGNMPGRGMGERLGYDPNNDSILFYAASDGNGLWKSTNGGINWAQVTAFPNPGNWAPQATDPIDIWNRTPGVVWVAFDKRTGTSGNATQTIYVGVADLSNAIYVSNDGGASWSRLAGQPTGFLCHRGIVEPTLGYLYTTWNNSGGPFTGGSGDVWKYSIASSTWTRITPVPPSGWGYNGIGIDRSNPSILMVGTQSAYWPDGAVWRSVDGGATWSKSWEYTNGGASRSFRTVLDVSAAPWMANPGTFTAPQYNIQLGAAVDGISIDPFNPNNVFVSGGWAGLWRSTNLTSWVPGGSGTCTFTVGSRGIQGNGITDMISPPSGAPLLTTMLDLGGFRHTDLTVVPTTRHPVMWFENSSIDFAENDPNQIVRVGKGQVGNGDSGRSIAISGDNGITWTVPNQPANTLYGGTVASSCNGTANMVWAPGSGVGDVSVPVSYSTNGGNSWSSSTGIPAGAQVRADRVTPGKFYGFLFGNFYVSTNQGVSFSSTASGLPIWGDMRPVFGRAGDIWLAGETGGLWHSSNSGSNWTKLSNVAEAWTVGFGKAASGQSYPAVYIGGRIGSTYGIYRSDNGGANWTRMTDSAHQYGSLTVAITADRNIYGRCYSTTGFGGVIYSTITSSNAPPANLVATPADSAVQLSWDGSAGADSYIVKRSTISGSGYTAIASGVTATSFADASVVNGTTYYYVVAATNIYGASLNSAEASATPGEMFGWWKFDATSGTTAADSGYGGNPGTLQSGATWVVGAISNAVHLDGTANGYASLPSGLVSALNDFTISTWVKVDANATWARVFDFGSGTGNYMFLSPASGGASVRYAITTSGNGGEQQLNRAGNLSTGVWHHLAVTLSGSTGVLYVGGVPADTNLSMTLKPSSLGSTTQNYIGKSQWPDPNLTGSVDDFRIYSRALSATEVAALANPVPPAPAGLAAVAGNAQVALNWNAASTATGYKIKRSLTSGSGYANIATNASLTFTNTGLANGTLYYFVVSAVNTYGESTNSTQVSARPTSSASVAIGMTSAPGQLQFSWPADHTGWQLQSQTNNLTSGLGTNWVNVPASIQTNQMTVPLNSTNGSVFFRLARPY
jgi:xyloglucan-specific exo-beta-1,4-glucanase